MTTDTPTGLLLSGPSSTGKTTLGRVIQDLLPTVDTTGKDPREVARQLGAWLDTGLVPTALRR